MRLRQAHASPLSFALITDWKINISHIIFKKLRASPFWCGSHILFFMLSLLFWSFILLLPIDTSASAFLRERVFFLLQEFVMMLPVMISVHLLVLHLLVHLLLRVISSHSVLLLVVLKLMISSNSFILATAWSAPSLGATFYPCKRLQPNMPHRSIKLLHRLYSFSPSFVHLVANW